MMLTVFFYSFPRMHLALKAYMEVLQTLHVMTTSKIEAVRANADVIKGASSLDIHVHVTSSLLIDRLLQATSST